ncbi:uncharacterized protein LOC129286314 [Prosopis cineraria]|uniref:uncharacterized protein LOC129286314 n=1 Tax=Prosopis cineraria TaxID=364024 RepID=UPI00240EC81D|nr:uncharacterized protein LOC129286314 [Prosopis cineraria]
MFGAVVDIFSAGIALSDFLSRLKTFNAILLNEFVADGGELGGRGGGVSNLFLTNRGRKRSKFPFISSSICFCVSCRRLSCCRRCCLIFSSPLSLLLVVGVESLNPSPLSSTSASSFFYAGASVFLFLLSSAVARTWAMKAVANRCESQKTLVPKVFESSVILFLLEIARYCCKCVFLLLLCLRLYIFCAL